MRKRSFHCKISCLLAKSGGSAPRKVRESRILQATSKRPHWNGAGACDRVCRDKRDQHGRRIGRGRSEADGEDRLRPYRQELGRGRCAAEADPVRPSLTGHGRHGRTSTNPSTSATDAGRADPQISVSRPHCLSGGREEAEDAQAASACQLRNDTWAISAEVGIASRLSHGGTELRQSPLEPRKAERPRPKARKRCSGTDEHGREK